VPQHRPLVGAVSAPRVQAVTVAWLGGELGHEFRRPAASARLVVGRVLEAGVRWDAALATLPFVACKTAGATRGTYASAGAGVGVERCDRLDLAARRARAVPARCRVRLAWRVPPSSQRARGAVGVVPVGACGVAVERVERLHHRTARTPFVPLGEWRASPLGSAGAFSLRTASIRACPAPRVQAVTVARERPERRRREQRQAVSARLHAVGVVVTDERWHALGAAAVRLVHQPACFAFVHVPVRRRGPTVERADRLHLAAGSAQLHESNGMGNPARAP